MHHFCSVLFHVFLTLFSYTYIASDTSLFEYPKSINCIDKLSRKQYCFFLKHTHFSLFNISYAKKVQLKTTAPSYCLPENIDFPISPDKNSQSPVQKIQPILLRIVHPLSPGTAFPCRILQVQASFPFLPSAGTAVS